MAPGFSPLLATVSVSHSTFLPLLKTREFLRGSKCHGTNSVMGPKARVQRKSRQTEPPSEAHVGAHLLSSGLSHNSGFSWEERQWRELCIPRGLHSRLLTES